VREVLCQSRHFCEDTRQNALAALTNLGHVTPFLLLGPPHHLTIQWFKLRAITPSKIACPEMTFGARSSYDWQLLACWLVHRIASVLLGRWSVVVIRLVKRAFICTGSATVTTTAEITGTKAARCAVGWLLSILVDWCIWLTNFIDWFLCTA